jgi:hypothetical protein
MKFTLKRNQTDSAMIEAYTGASHGGTYLAFIVHEDIIGGRMLDALSDSGDEIDCYLTLKEPEDKSCLK